MQTIKQVVFIGLVLLSTMAFGDDLERFTRPFRLTLICAGSQERPYLGGTPEECSANCLQDNTCQSFVFYPSRPLSQVRCNFKSDTTLCKKGNDEANFYRKFTSSINVDTGSGQTQTFLYTNNVDCALDDIAVIRAAAPESCGAACVNQSGCVAFSYGNNQCAMKKSTEYCTNYQEGTGYTTYQKFGSPTSRAPTPPVSTCNPGDVNCRQKIRDGGFDNKNTSMYMYPRITRDKTEIDKKDGDATKVLGDASTAVLLQTSYLARVMVQANDVFPPSHVSTRTSGETYLSSVMPFRYNLKTLSESSIKRNTLGAENYSSSSAQSGEVITLVRDWVEQHLNNYCDPLAAKVGIYNCTAPSSSTSSDLKNNGTTTWDNWKSDQKISFAEDLNASTLFQSKIAHPEAAMRYIYNVTNNLPTPIDSSSPNFTIPDKYLTTFNNRKVLKNEGYSAYMSYIERQSKQSLSQYAMMKIFAEHLELSSVKIPVTKWTDDGKVTTYETTSRQGLLEFESTKRFSDPGWYDRVQQMPTPALLKEIAYMQALQLTLEFKRYEQQQIQIAQFAAFASELSSMADMAKDMAKNNDPQKAADAFKNQLGGLGINLPDAGTKVDFNSNLENVIKK